LIVPHFKKLIGELCYLSPCDREDAERWTTWDNDLEVSLPLGSEAHATIGLDKNRENLENLIHNGNHVFNIVDLATDQAIGRCMLDGIDLVDRRAMLGIDIGDKSYWGRGYGQESVRLLVDYGFNLLNLNSIMLGVFEFNERAQACYRKVGFKEIGRRRQARIVGGRKYDVILMDLLAEEFTSIYVLGILDRHLADE
jgi:RimJ/RimL family protein N-acetyltransferase